MDRDTEYTSTSMSFMSTGVEVCRGLTGSYCCQLWACDIVLSCNLSNRLQSICKYRHPSKLIFGRPHRFVCHCWWFSSCREEGFAITHNRWCRRFFFIRMVGYLMPLLVYYCIIANVLLFFDLYKRIHSLIAYLVPHSSSYSLCVYNWILAYVLFGFFVFILHCLITDNSCCLQVNYSLIK